MYQIGDFVMHPGHGGCIVQAIGPHTFRGVSEPYYTLSPQADDGTMLYAPVKSAEKIGIRKVISEDEADRVLHYYKGVQPEWISNHKLRKNAYDTIVRSGTLSELAKMVKELLTHAEDGKLTGGEQALLPRASKKLFSELALAKGLAFEQVYLMARSITAIA